MGKDTKQEARLLKGLFKDSGEIDQPENTWRYALNALMNEQKGSVSNEKGTQLAGYVRTDGSIGDQRDHAHFYKIIGAIEIDFNRTILFVADTRPKVIDPLDPTNNYYPQHLIGLFDDVKGVHSSFRILYKPITDPQNTNAYPAFDLNFSINFPIEGTYRIDSKEDVIVYWTDDLNPPRALNISRQLRQKDPMGNDRPSFWLYNIDPALTHSKHIGLLDLFPSTGPVPTINSAFKNSGLSMVGQGGGLLTGVYYLAVAYIDEDFVSTNYLTVSNPVSIVPGYSHTRPTTKNDGAKPGTQTSKSITWNIQNINTDYKYLKCAVVRKKGDATEAFQLSDKVIVGDITDPNGTNNLQISFAGTEGFTPLAVEDVMIDTVSYDTAKTITQMDNILYMGNLTGSPDLGYQKYANNIKVNAHKMPIDTFDEVIMSLDNMYSGFANSPVDSLDNIPTDISDKQSYRDPEMNTYKRGYRRGEVYAFYIAFILNDGSMSYAYHIPGREPVQPKPVWPQLYSHTYGGSTTRTDYEYWSIPSGPSPQHVHHNSIHPGVKSFHFYDCSQFTTGTDANARFGGLGGSRHMAYWHNLNETYPDDRAISEVWDRNTYENGVLLNGAVTGFYNTCPNCNNGAPYTGSGMQGMQVRHHKMPSNSNAWARTIEPDVVGESVPSQPQIVTAGTFTGSFVTKTNVSSWWLESTFSKNNSCKGNKIFAAPSSITYVAPSTSGDPLPWSTSSDKITALANNTIVTAKVKLRVHNDNNGCSRTHHSRVRYKETPSSATQTKITSTEEVGTNDWDWHEYNVGVINLQIGGSVWVESAGDTGGTYVGGCPHKHGGCGSYERHIKYSTTKGGVTWTVAIGTGTTDSYDVDLKQDVNRLGISLEDINIPKTYYDKIQGFRIYYAKRSYTNKTILGQAPVIPMSQGSSRLGICEEAVTNGQVNADVQDQTLSVATTGPEAWIAKEAWAYDPTVYAPFSVATNINFQNTWKRLNSAGNEYKTVAEGYYKYFSFYDFNMLDNHHSIAGATHIQLTYVSNNWTWNGPTLYQPKKMLSEIKCATTGANVGNPDIADSGLYKIRERWGWDGSVAGVGPQNCYNKNIKSAIFAGGKYITAQEFLGKNYMLTRLLSQKAKTYLNGDSILLAQPLGFSGKIINTYGDSTIALALKDMAELPALYSSMDGTFAQASCPTCLAGTVFNTTNTAQAEWGIPPTVNSVLPSLSNPSLQKTNISNIWSYYSGTENEPDATSSLTYITNLCAFKTDVYRSVDNQELVWTGFQVVGKDLHNFFFENEYLIPNLSNPAANGYGNLVVNPNFSNQWRPDVVLLPASGVGVQIVIQNVNGGAGGTATATISTAGILTGVVLNTGGSGYTEGATAYLKLHGKKVDWITLSVTDNGAGVLTGVTSIYTQNTFKIETGECMSYCDDDTFNASQEVCVTGLCTKTRTVGSTVFFVDLGTEAEDDPAGLTGGATPITNQATCVQHGSGRKFSGFSIVSYEGLTLAEYNLEPGVPYGGGWSANVFAGGGNDWVEDCGGIYGGDTIITRQGISTGAAPLEEDRDSSPVHAIHYHIVESEDNINFRHMENKNSVYFPESVASNILRDIGTGIDPNTQDEMKYDKNYSALNDVRSAIPLPIKDSDRSTFPTRTIRSTRNDATGIIDNYRIWLANQFKDLPKNRGQLWKLSTFNNLIYFHMEASLFKAAGKQTMQMGDGSDAYVGSGDIFKQEPTEIIQTESGYGGTQSQYAALTTRFGYFFVDRKGKKVFMMKDTLMEISALGMENWFVDNMNYELIKYGATELDGTDNPIVGLGYHSVWDPYNKRILLTKRDLLPTQDFIDGFNMTTGGGGLWPPGKIKWFPSSGVFKIFYSSKGGAYGWKPLAWNDETYFTKSGWTLSYYPDQAVWCSFHSFIPYIYFNTTETFYSVTDKFYVWDGLVDPLYATNNEYTTAFGTSVGNKGIWKHNYGNYGLLYQDNVMNTMTNSNWRDVISYATFEMEVIQNKLRAVDTLTSSIGYLIDVINTDNVRVLEHGFTSFYVYNTFQISGDEVSSPLEYLVNTRRIGNHWKVNRFRDMSLDILRGPAGPQVDPYYMSTNLNVVGQINVGTMTTNHNTSMFTKSGAIEIVNPGYLDLSKNNLTRRKFIDKWIGIRLIYNNITNNLLNLYSTSVEARKMYR